MSNFHPLDVVGRVALIVHSSKTDKKNIVALNMVKPREYYQIYSISANIILLKAVWLCLKFYVSLETLV